MSLILRELLQELAAPSIYDQNFALGLNDLDIVPNSTSKFPRHHQQLSDLRKTVVSYNVTGESNFQVSLDVQQFKPEELNVKITENFVVVEGKHEERSDQHGFVSRQFTRRYKLPENINQEALQSTLSSDGVLQVSAPLKSTQKVSFSIPITKVNQPALVAADVNGETAKTGENMPVTPTSSPSQPILKKPRLEVSGE